MRSAGSSTNVGPSAVLAGPVASHVTLNTTAVVRQPRATTRSLRPHDGGGRLRSALGLTGDGIFVLGADCSGSDSSRT